MSHDSSGWLAISTEGFAAHHNGSFHVACRDDGCSIRDLEDLRVVYLTHKTDSHRKRGRFGRGFKEALCIAEEAQVVSGGRSLAILVENGRRISRLSEPAAPLAGTEVTMRMPWGPETAEQLDGHFAQFLVPESMALSVNGWHIQPRPVAHRIEASTV